jgi:DNA topoisomerase-1
MFTIQLPDALELFKLPRSLGKLPTGEPVSANTGQFGPYVQYEILDTSTGEVKKKYVSLTAHEPLKITLEEAIEVIRAKQEADANKLVKDFGVDNLRILRGRWGPYLTDAQKNARLPKDREPETITLDEARVLIANAPLPKRRWGRPVTKKKVAKKAARKKAGPAAGGNGELAPVGAAAKPAAKPRKKAARKAGKAKPAAGRLAKPAAG